MWAAGMAVRRGGPGARKLSAKDLERIHGQLRDNAPALTTLSLHWNAIGAEGAAKLARHLRGNSALTSLDLRLNRIGESGAQALCGALAANRALTHLDLHTCDLGDSGCRAVAELLQRNSTLRSLGLENNSIGPAGAAAVAEMLAVNTSLQHLDIDRNPLDDGAWAIARTLKTRLEARPVNFEIVGVNLVLFWRELGLPERACEHEWRNEDVLAYLRGEPVGTGGHEGHVAEPREEAARACSAESSSDDDIVAPIARRHLPPGGRPSDSVPADTTIAPQASSSPTTSSARLQHLPASKGPAEKDSSVHPSNRVAGPVSPLPREEVYAQAENALDEVFLPAPTYSFANADRVEVAKEGVHEVMPRAKGSVEDTVEAKRENALFSAVDGPTRIGGAKAEENRKRAVVSAANGSSRAGGDKVDAKREKAVVSALEWATRIGGGGGADLGQGQTEVKQPSSSSHRQGGGQLHASRTAGREAVAVLTCGRCMCCREYEVRMRGLAEEIQRHPLWELIDEVRRLQEEVEQGKKALGEQRKTCDRLRQVDAERIATLEVRCVAEKESFERLRKVDADKIASLHKENLALHQARVCKGEEESEVVRGLHQKLRRLQEKSDQHEDKEAVLLTLLPAAEEKMNVLATRALDLQAAVENAREKMLMGTAGRLRQEEWMQERERVMGCLESSDAQVRRLKRQLKDLMNETGKLQQRHQQDMCKVAREHDGEKELVGKALAAKLKAMERQVREREEDKAKVVTEWEDVTTRLKKMHVEEVSRLKRRLSEQDERYRTRVREHEEEVRKLQKSMEDERLNGKTKMQKLEDDIKRLRGADSRAGLSIDSLSGALPDFPALSSHVGSLPEMPGFALNLPGLSGISGGLGGGEGSEGQGKEGGGKDRGGSGWAEGRALSPSSESSGEEKVNARGGQVPWSGVLSAARPPLLLSSRAAGNSGEGQPSVETWWTGKDLSKRLESTNVPRVPPPRAIERSDYSESGGGGGGGLIDSGGGGHMKGRAWAGLTDWHVFKGAADGPAPDGAVPPPSHSDKWNPLSFSALEFG